MARVLVSEPGLTEAGTLEKSRGGDARRLTRQLQRVSRGLWPADPDLGLSAHTKEGLYRALQAPGLGSASVFLRLPNEFTNLLT